MAENRSSDDGIDRRSILKSIGAGAGVGLSGLGTAADDEVDEEDIVYEHTLSDVLTREREFADITPAGSLREILNLQTREKDGRANWLASGLLDQQVIVEEPPTGGDTYTIYVHSQVLTHGADLGGDLVPTDDAQYWHGEKKGEAVDMEQPLTVPLKSAEKQMFTAVTENKNARITDVKYTRCGTFGVWGYGKWHQLSNPQENINVLDAYENSGPLSWVNTVFGGYGDVEKAYQYYEAVQRLTGNVTPEFSPKKLSRILGGTIQLLTLTETYGRIAENCNSKMEFDSFSEVVLDYNDMAGTPYSKLYGEYLRRAYGDEIEERGVDLWEEETHHVTKGTFECGYGGLSHTARLEVTIPEGESDIISLASGFGFQATTLGSRLRELGQSVYLYNDTADVTLQARFSLPHEKVAAGQTVRFNGAESLGDVDDYEWRFQGPIGTVAEDTWTESGLYTRTEFTTPGTYEARLTVTHEQVQDSTTIEFEVTENDPPAADLELPDAPRVDDEVGFSAEPSEDVDGYIQSYEWQFDGPLGDRFTPEQWTSDGLVTFETFSAPGEYEVELTVTDAQGVMDSTSKRFTVADAVTATITADLEDRTLGDTVEFDASNSSVNGNATYDWTLSHEDGAEISASGSTTSYRFETKGRWTASLTVTDGDGDSDTASRSFYVSGTGSGGLAAGLSPQSKTVEQSDATIEFDASNSTAPSSTIERYEWHFGDGTVEETTSPTNSHEYTGIGKFTASVTVFDDNGNSDTETSPITVVEDYEGTLDADYTHSATTYVTGEPIDFQEDVRVSGDYEIDTYAWTTGSCTLSDPPSDNIGYGKNIQNTFEEPGEHWVYLEVTDNGTESDCWAYPFEILDSRPTIETPEDVYATDETTITTDETGHERYRWTLTDPSGDRRKSGFFGESFDYEFDETGEWTVSLRIENVVEAAVENNTVHYDQTSTVTVEPKPNDGPNAVIDGPTKASVGEDVVEFDATKSSDADGTITEYAWTIERSGGDPVELSGETIEYGWGDVGEYDVGLTLTDDDGATASTSQTVSVVNSNEGPTAKFDGPSEVAAGSTASFDARESSDADGSIARYDWTVERPDGTSSASGEVTAISWSEAGTFTVTLTVTDDDGATATTEADVTVAKSNASPTARIDGPSEGFVDETATFDGSKSSDEDGTIESYEWTVVGPDGSKSTTTGSVELTQTWSMVGEYTVRLEVTDDDGAPAETTQSVSVTDPNEGPNADISVPNPVSVGESVTLDGSASSDSDGTIVTYEWDIQRVVGSANETGETVQTSWNAGGEYDVSLTVEDDDGARNSASTVVMVTDEFSPNVTVTPQQPSTTEPTEFTVEPSDSNYTISSADWSIAGQDYSGKSVTHEFISTGHKNFGVTVETEGGLTEQIVGFVYVEDDIIFPSTTE